MMDHCEEPYVDSLKFELNSNQGRVPMISDISYEHFYEYYLKRNLPCIITSVGNDWKSSKLWCQNGKPNYKYLESKYGDSVITVHHCSEKFFDSHKTSTMKFKDYISYWVQYSAKEDKEGMELLYLKDWHLKNECKDDEFYQVPEYFTSDWLNEYLVANNKDDYRFVYMGPAGSWTPLHKDVMNTFSWSVNICGYKKWILFPPGQETSLLNESGQLPSSVENLPENIKYFIVMQHPGDALFVPSQWYHQVWNLDDTISINHNWANACNITYMKSSISQGLLEIKKELEHIYQDDSYLNECQDILRCHVGMNSQEFFQFISFIVFKRIEEYKSLTSEESVKGILVFELRQIERLLSNSWSIGPAQDEDAKELKQHIESVFIH